jgi:hypothetical protein
VSLTRVTVRDGSGTADMSVREFLALPLDRRVQLVLEQQLQFYDQTGAQIPAADGLKLLRAAREAMPA